MMKKIFAGLLLSGIAICHVSGQTALEGNKFSDNWSIGINVGGVTPLTHHSFFKTSSIESNTSCTACKYSDSPGCLAERLFIIA